MPRPDRSRAALIDTAALLFRRQGYAATGVNQILETADVKAGSLYHHFPDGKQQLAAAVVESAGGEIERLLRRFLDSDSSVADIVDGWIDLLIVAARLRWPRRLPDRTDRHRVGQCQLAGARRLRPGIRRLERRGRRAAPRRRLVGR